MSSAHGRQGQQHARNTYEIVADGSALCNDTGITFCNEEELLAFRTKTNVAYTLLKKIRTTLGKTNSTVANSISPAHVVYQYAVQQKLKLVTGPPEKQTVTDGSGTRRTYVVSRLFLQDEEQQTKFSCSGKSVSTERAAKQVAAANLLQVIIDHRPDALREISAKYLKGNTATQAPKTKGNTGFGEPSAQPPSSLPLGMDTNQLSGLLNSLRSQKHQSQQQAPNVQDAPPLAGLDQSALFQLQQALDGRMRQTGQTERQQHYRDESMIDNFKRRKIEVPQGHQLLRHEQLPSPRDPRAGIIYPHDLIDRLRASQ